MNPLSIKAQLWTAAVAAMLLMACASWALIERAGRLELKATNAYLAAQGNVLAASVAECTAGVERVKQLSDLAIASLGELMEKARKISEPKWRTVERIEKIIEKPAPPGAGCDTAWDEIEADRKARAP